MTTALVPLNPDAGPPDPILRFASRDEILDRLEDFSVEALMTGSTALAYVLERVVVAFRGARGMDLSTDLLLFLEREQLLQLVREPTGWIRARDVLDELSPTGVFTIVDEVPRP